MIIRLSTFIKADPSIVFNLSRSIELHKISTVKTQEEAIAGKTSGLIALNEFVTWRAWHLFKWRTMTVQVTAMEPFSYFEDRMIAGDFKSFIHQHHFIPGDGGTMMTDLLEFESPLDWVGKCIDLFFMKRYLARLLASRNNTIRQYAESGDWKKLLY
jgi:ligand-binding SRPBCC domain-containing protein